MVEKSILVGIDSECPKTYFEMKITISETNPIMTSHRGHSCFSKNGAYSSKGLQSRILWESFVRSSLEIGDSNSGGSLAPNAYYNTGTNDVSGTSLHFRGLF